MGDNRNVICHANHKSHMSHHVFVKCVDIFPEEIHRPRLHLLSTPLSCLHFTTGSWHTFGHSLFESLSTAILLVLYNSMFVIYYHLLAGLLFHFEDTLQMAILLTRMKIFNSFVRKHFTQKPQLIASSLFLTCLFIDSPVAFALKISSYHYYTDNKQENVNTFYIMTASDFSLTPYGVNSSWRSLHFSSIYCSHSSWVSYWILSRCVSTNCIWERKKS